MNNINGDEVYLKHILEAISWIEKYIHNIDKDKFMSDHLIQDGIIRQLEIIGEATRHISAGLQSRTKQIPWKDISGMRNRLIHNYFGVDLNAVWKTAITDIQVLKNEIDLLLK